MARYGKDHKEETRRRMVRAAGRRLKQDGLGGSGVSALMADAGLTNGAFYAHFGSKDELVAAAVTEQLQDQRAVLGSLVEDPDGFARFVRGYLSPEHRDDRADGCPSAALLDEVARGAPVVRRAYTAGVEDVAGDLAALVAGPGAQQEAQQEAPQGAPGGGGDGGGAPGGSSRARALAAVAALAGAIQLARALDDEELSREVLAASAELVLSLAGPPPG